MQKITKLLLLVFICVNLSACIGTVVGAAVDTTIEVVKVPFKVVGAAVDVVTGDDFSQQDGALGDDNGDDFRELKIESDGIQ